MTRVPPWRPSIHATVRRSGDARCWDDYLCPSATGSNLLPISAAPRCERAVDRTSRRARPVTIRQGTEMCTPVSDDGHVQFGPAGTRPCLLRERRVPGRPVYEQCLAPPPDRMYASGVLAERANPRVSGKRHLCRGGRATVPTADNRIETDTSIFHGSPAISRGQILLRSDKCLYCVGQPGYDPQNGHVTGSWSRTSGRYRGSGRLAGMTFQHNCDAGGSPILWSERSNEDSP